MLMIGVHKKVFCLGGTGSRMKISELGDLFPQNQVFAKCFDMDCAKEIEEQYKIIEKAVEELKKKEEQSTGLAIIVRARMRIEMLKVPTFIELSKKYIDEGFSVALFVNFTQTLKTLGDQLKTNCFIFGEQTMDEREQNIKQFNENKSKIIICNIRSGGVGISLHDTKGGHPRVSIISPSWSAQDIIQALGRTFRSKGKTPVQQRIIFCKNTIEETICTNMKDKIKNIANLNDGHISNGYQIKGLIDEKTCQLEDNMSDFDRTFQKINVLSMKRERLQKEIKEVDDEIKSLQLALNSLIH
jgi:SNF2 family DNA or RNA helicase